MNIEDIKPNSIDAIICFGLYICAQDKVISEQEKISLVNLTLDASQNEYKDYGFANKEKLKNHINEISKVIMNSSWLHKYTSKDEKKIVNDLINDIDTIKIALRVSRIAASADDFSEREHVKFKYWIDYWSNLIIDS